MDRFNNLLNGIQNSIESSQKITKAYCKIKAGDKVRNTNTACMHYGSEGIVDEVEPMPDNIGYVVSYTATNDGSTWKPGEILRKTHDQLSVLETLPKTLLAQEEDMEEEEESPEYELTEYKLEYLEMALNSLKNIMSNVSGILDHADLDRVKENLTEPWLQGMIAVVEDNMSVIHDFVKFSDDPDDNPSEAAAQNRPGLWENIRKKKEREGKKYKPAKPGDPDRPDTKQWKKLQKENKDKDK